MIVKELVPEERQAPLFLTISSLRGKERPRVEQAGNLSWEAKADLSPPVTVFT
jgi:hypothetical protein